MVRSTITIEFQKEGFAHRDGCEHRRIFASTHGDHTVKIVDFATGKVLRVRVVMLRVMRVDTGRTSSYPVGRSFSPEESRYHCEWLSGLCGNGLELEEERDSRIHADHAKRYDFLTGLAPFVCTGVVCHC